MALIKPIGRIELSVDEQVLLAGFRLLNPETRADWLCAAKWRIQRAEEQSKNRVIDFQKKLDERNSHGSEND